MGGCDPGLRLQGSQGPCGACSDAWVLALAETQLSPEPARQLGNTEILRSDGEDSPTSQILDWGHSGSLVVALQQEGWDSAVMGLDPPS